MDLKVLLKEEKINIMEDYPIGYSSGLKCGGRSRYAAFPESAEEASMLIKAARKCSLEVYFAGGCTNILVSDETIDGLVISTEKLRGIVIKGDLVTAYAGEKLDQVINRAIEHNLTGLEKLGGIPGTVGGALVGNAGANGSEIRDHFFFADYLDRDGNIARMPNYVDSFGYRSSPFTSDMFVVTVSFRLTPSRFTAEARKEKEEHLRERVRKGQYRYPSIGCFFKNIEGRSAGEIIDQCGMKGMRIGDAQVSVEHANFIVNTGNATSSDIYALSELVRRTVEEKTGIKLEYEIKFLGHFRDQAQA